MRTVELDGRSLSFEELEMVSRGLASVELSAPAREAMERSRRAVEAHRDSGEVVYGVTTGFGRLADVPIDQRDQRALQVNLLRSHAAGWGTLLSPVETRTLMLLRANALARGFSGIRPLVVDRLLEMLNRGLLPAIPETGSVGASGDLAPLAHMALPLMGEGAFHPSSPGLPKRSIPVGDRGGIAGNGAHRADGHGQDAGIPAGPVLSAGSFQPLALEAKEGLALINGTQATTGVGTLAWLRIRDTMEVLEVAGAMTLEALLGTPRAFDARVHEARGQDGQIRSAARLRALLHGSEIRESHRQGDPRVQDAYSLRCMPQVHGAARSALRYAREILAAELNAVTDNPLIFPGEGDAPGEVISAGNFHAQVVSQALDVVCMAVADLASVSERRLERLLNPDLSGLPAFLAPEPGLQSGFMILQVTVADLLAELRVLAHPVSSDSVPTSAGQEDHVSMGLASARKVRRAAELLQVVAAAELLAASQALEYRRPLRSSPPLEEVHQAIRQVVPSLEEDRSPAPDLEAIRRLMEEGRFMLELEPGPDLA
ncbi:MAG: histidine ammonia-lyase [Gemmatimonadales bacterium]|nr:MAG: histidine ammonia-lyase [Gemmatimonadales bacterium]